MDMAALFEVLGNGKMFILSSCMKHGFFCVAPEALIKILSADASDHDLGVAAQQCMNAFRPLTAEESEVFFGADSLFKTVRKEHDLKLASLAGFKSVSGMYKEMKYCLIGLSRDEKSLVVNPTRRRSPGKYRFLLPDYDVVLDANLSVEELGFAVRDGIDRSS
jgi:hypothetical protein